MPEATPIEVAKEAGDSTPPAEQGASSASQTAPTAPSAKEPTMADVARQAYEASLAKHGADDPSPGQQLAQTEDTKEKGEGEEEPPKTEEPTTEGEEAPEVPAVEKETETEKTPEEKAAEDALAAITDPYAKLPFHKHPDFQKLVTKKNEAEQSLKDVAPIIAEWQHHHQFLQHWGITQERFVQAMNILSLEQTDPAKAREMLKPTWDRLAEYSGDNIPADLKSKLDLLPARIESGELSEAAAKELEGVYKETAKLRAAQKSAVVQTTSNQQAQTALALRNQTQACNDWERAKMASDPGFKQGSKLRDFVSFRFSHACSAWMAHNNAPFIPAQVAVQLLEKSYQDTKKDLTPTTPKTPTKPVLSSSRSSTTPRKAEKDMTPGEIAASVARRHGIAYSPNGR